jgi:hypothetical protein
LNHKAVVLRGGDQVEAGAVTRAMGRAFKAAHKETFEQGFVSQRVNSTSR